MNMMLILVLFLFIIGGIGILAYKTLDKILHSSCISVGKTGSGYSCACETGITKDNCETKNGVWQSNPCGKVDEWDRVCKTQILGSCVTSSGCHYPILESECKSSGTWSKDDKCSSS